MPETEKTSTRQALIAAAQELVVDGGWGSVTTRRVADRAGVSPGVVHYHTGSIEQLRRIAVCEGARALLEGPFREAVDARSLREGLLAFLSRLDSGPDDPRVALLNEALVAATHDTALRTDLAAMFSAFRSRLVERLTAQEGAQTGEAEARALVLVAAVDGFLLQSALDPTLDADWFIRGMEPLLITELAPE
ncbi:TetR/AcrR family transcriptional regulator [Actinomyces wuliandei]|uniref:TetR/AcrR family transcriptional regulator n=1 Tax=Actinomyces wuliandei TaxID=2057743 RepID=UPI0013E2C3E5|nr:TetR family transcriptional regulator [Actinomyces wuliandei]